MEKIQNKRSTQLNNNQRLNIKNDHFQHKIVTLKYYESALVVLIFIRNRKVPSLFAISKPSTRIYNYGTQHIKLLNVITAYLYSIGYQKPHQFAPSRFFHSPALQFTFSPSLFTASLAISNKPPHSCFGSEKKSRKKKKNIQKGTSFHILRVPPPLCSVHILHLISVISSLLW